MQFELREVTGEGDSAKVPLHKVRYSMEGATGSFAIGSGGPAYYKPLMLEGNDPTGVLTTVDTDQEIVYQQTGKSYHIVVPLKTPSPIIETSDPNRLMMINQVFSLSGIPTSVTINKTVIDVPVGGPLQ